MAPSEQFEPQNLNRWTEADPAFGSTNNYSGGDFSEFYVAPCSITRDTSDALSLSNWETMVEGLDALTQHEDSGETSFNHWACGWYSIYLIHETDTAALKAADAMAANLEDYPILDEVKWSEKEHELENEAWENWARADWRSTVEKRLQEYAPAEADTYWADEILDTIPEDTIDTLWADISAYLGWTVEHDSDGPRFNFSDAADHLECATLAELTGLPLLPVSQEWRREPYPWPGGDAAPLAPSLPV
jgi:hypothetical protein